MRTVTTIAFVAAALCSGARADLCVGDCGTEIVSDGVVSKPPNGATEVRFVSTYEGITGVGAPLGVSNIFSDGSPYTTSTFSLGAGTVVQGYYNYVTSNYPVASASPNR